MPKHKSKLPSHARIPTDAGIGPSLSALHFLLHNLLVNCLFSWSPYNTRCPAQYHKITLIDCRWPTNEEAPTATSARHKSGLPKGGRGGTGRKRKSYRKRERSSIGSPVRLLRRLEDRARDDRQLTVQLISREKRAVGAPWRHKRNYECSPPIVDVRLSALCSARPPLQRETQNAGR